MGQRAATDEILHFAEDVGVVMEHTGIPRIAGKIYALLLITHRPHLSADEIADTLHASRASVSTMTRLLLRAGLVDKVGITGERKTYYRLKPGATADLLRGSLSQLTVFRKAIEHGLTLVRDRSSQAGRRLQELLDFFIFFEREFPLLIDRWESQSRKPRKA